MWEKARFLKNVTNRALVRRPKDIRGGILPNLVANDEPTGQIIQSRHASKHGRFATP
jgi:hypothetical protein